MSNSSVKMFSSSTFLVHPSRERGVAARHERQQYSDAPFAGRGDAVDGEVFEWVFPVGPTYWQQAANDVVYIKEQLGSDLENAKIGFIYLDYPFAQEPIEILETLSEKEGFELELYPVPLPGSDQSGAWSKIRRDKPDYVISWPLAGDHVVASKEMRRNGFPIDRSTCR